MIGAPAYRALTAQGVAWLEDLPRWSEAELLKLHGVGPKAVRILKETLASRGLALRVDHS
jgi:DNA-directed RNA polymerase alpha subunit